MSLSFTSENMTIPSRDRLPRPVDISTLFRGAARKVDLIVDQPGLSWKGLSGNGPRNVSSGRAVGFRVAARGRTWNVQRSQRSGGGGGGRGRDINWPSWYRRRPLQDISALVEAIERRRAEVNQTREAQQEENAQVEQQESAQIEQEQTSIAQLEQEIGSQTPLPTVFAKARPSPSTQALKITPKNANNSEIGSGFMTPQRRLLDSIDKVREYWLEEQKRLQRTPAAKKAERERKVRTLMSMR